MSHLRQPFGASVQGFRISMQSNLTEFQRRKFGLIRRVSPFATAGHLVNTTVLVIALVGSVPLLQMIIWCVYSYSIALVLLYRLAKSRGRSPRNFERAAKKVMINSFFLALPWSSSVILYLGVLSHDQ
jgi:hypothetical protein